MNSLNHFLPAQPSESGLLDWLRQGTSRKMIEEIAANDYGKEVSEHFAAIQRQLSDDPIKGLLPWWPREVLELQRWFEPEIGSQDQPLDESREHRKRLLACVLLLQSAATLDFTSLVSEEEDFLETSASTLIQLVRSSLLLGGECSRHSLEFLLWLCNTIEFPRLRPFIAFSAFLLWLEENGGCAACDAIETAWEWVGAEEHQSRILNPGKVASKRWLVGISYYENGTGSRQRWSATARQVLQRQAHCMEQIKAILAVIGED